MLSIFRILIMCDSSVQYKVCNIRVKSIDIIRKCGVGTRRGCMWLYINVIHMWRDETVGPRQRGVIMHTTMISIKCMSIYDIYVLIYKFVRKSLTKSHSIYTCHSKIIYFKYLYGRLNPAVVAIIYI